MTKHLTIKLEGAGYTPGEAVTGTVETLTPMKCKELTVALEYRDWTPDYHAVSREVPLQAPLHVGDLEEGQSFSFSIALPADALPGQSGTYGSTSWGVHARLAHLGPDVHAWQPLKVAEPAHARQGA